MPRTEASTVAEEAETETVFSCPLLLPLRRCRTLTVGAPSSALFVPPTKPTRLSLPDVCVPSLPPALALLALSPLPPPCRCLLSTAPGWRPDALLLKAPA